MLLKLTVVLFSSFLGATLQDVLAYYNVAELANNVNGDGYYGCHDNTTPDITFRTLLNTDLSAWNKDNTSMRCIPDDTSCELNRIAGSNGGCTCVGAFQQAILVEEFPYHGGFKVTYNNVFFPNTTNCTVSYRCDDNVSVTCENEANNQAVDMVINTPGACGHDLPLPYKSEEEKSFFSWGVVIFLIIIILVGLYFLIGMPIMYFCFQKRGSEMLPCSAQIAGFFGLVMDGFKAIFGSCMPNSRSGFRAI